MNLEETRKQIDHVDQEIVALLEKRMQLVTEVTAYKRTTGKQVLDSSREERVLEKIASHVQEKDFEATIVHTYQDIMKHSRAYQTEKLSNHEA